MPGRRASEASYLSEQRLGNAPQIGCNAVATLFEVLRLQICMKPDHTYLRYCACKNHGNFGDSGARNAFPAKITEISLFGLRAQCSLFGRLIRSSRSLHDSRMADFRASLRLLRPTETITNLPKWSQIWTMLPFIRSNLNMTSRSAQCSHASSAERC